MAGIIRKKSGKLSKTQLLHLCAAVLQLLNASFFVALGLSPESALVTATFFGMFHSGIGVYLRMITKEPM